MCAALLCLEVEIGLGLSTRDLTPTERTKNHCSMQGRGKKKVFPLRGGPARAKDAGPVHQDEGPWVADKHADTLVMLLEASGRHVDHAHHSC